MSPDTLLKINRLSGGYHRQEIIKGISLDINRGDFIGIIGPNGSGKTTLLRLASRILTPRQGDVLLEGEDIRKMPLKLFCQKVAFVSEDTVVNFSFSVLEVVLMGRTPHLKRLQAESKEDIAIAKKSLEITDASGLQEKRFDEISSGERQRVAIAKALTQQPALLLLDEPTSHLDIGHKIQLLDLLKRLNRQDSLTIVAVLHDLNLASEYCNRVVLLEQGKIFKQGTPREVLTYQNIEAVYKTVVVVNDNPINSKPYVILVSKEK